jgi:hypothetical protein
MASIVVSIVISNFFHCTIMVTKKMGIFLKKNLEFLDLNP